MNELLDLPFDMKLIHVQANLLNRPRVNSYIKTLSSEFTCFFNSNEQ